jgi:hypothetical protein
MRTGRQEGGRAQSAEYPVVASNARNLHRRSSIQRAARKLVRRRRGRRRLEGPREEEFPGGCRSPGSDVAPTRAEAGPSSRPRTSERAESRTSRCAGANRPPVQAGWSAQDTWSIVRLVFDGTSQRHRKRICLRGWEVGAHEERCVGSRLEDLDPRYRRGDGRG